MPIENDLPDAPDAPPRATPLASLHAERGARMTGFAGWSLPLSYPAGTLAEHRHCREAAALFDISHMGQAWLAGAAAAEALETLVPGDIAGLAGNRARYTLLLNDAGGIADDIVVTRHAPDRLLLVLNAARTAEDLTLIATSLPGAVHLEPIEDRALLALQGPRAVDVLARHAPPVTALAFMQAAKVALAGAPCFVTRGGYTGEDGFEISVPADAAEHLARALLAEPEVAPAGLAARDTLRLEAGLCLHGADIDELTSPVEAGLTWTIARRRRATWDFPGATAIRDQIEHGPHRRRVGLRLDGRAPARAGALIVAPDGTGAGAVTSGTVSPSLNVPIAMGYVRKDLAVDGAELAIMVRERALPARVVPLPFVPHRYVR